MTQRILLVDDDQALLDGLKRILRKEGYEIQTANSAKAALYILENCTVNLIVTDEEMPGMCGTELLNLVRKEHPEIIAIMLTGKASLEVALQAINSGEVYRFFTKPCNDVELALAIREALKQRELISQSRRLVDFMRTQSKYIEELEHQHPGITKVNRNRTGAVVASKTLSLEEILREVSEELDIAESRLVSKKND